MNIFLIYRTFGWFFLATLLVVNPALGATTRINEIRIDQPGPDNDEYFELFGDPGGSLDGLTYIVIGDGPGGSGVIESVVGLTGLSLDLNGFFVAAESSFTLGIANLTTSLNFENSDNVTHLLTLDFTGTIGDDLDFDNDGSLDVTPWNQILDSVALIESGFGDLTYSLQSVGPDGSFVPSHVFRDVDGIGNFQIGAAGLAGGNDSAGIAVPGISPVPVPAAAWLFGTALIGLIGFSKRKIAS